MIRSVDWSRVAEVMRRARRQERESLRQFGSRLGFHHSIIHSLEQAKPVKTDGYLRVCAALHVDPYEAAGMRETTGE